MAEKTPEQLQQELDVVVAENAKLQEALAVAQKEAAENLELAKIADAKAAETAADVADLEKQLEASKNDTRIQVDARNKELELIKSLQTELEGLKKLSDEGKPTTEFELNGKRYQLLAAKVRIPGMNENHPLTALEVLNSPEAQAWLVAKNSGAIKELK